jgi:hypothetical protein
MPKRKLSAETTAIISAIESASATAKVVADSVAKELVLHTQHDDERFERLTALVESIGGDVKSLLDSRSFQRGAWKAISVVGGIAGTVAGLLVTFVKHLWAG